MDQCSRTLIFILSITSLTTGSGENNENSQKNWTEAQMYCRNHGKVLTNELVSNAWMSNQYYWTGFYIRISRWIKIIGCYDHNAVDEKMSVKTYKMRFPSSGLCQEFCLNFNLSIYGLKSNTCVCLEGLPLQGSRRSSDCNLPCDEEYSAETKIKYLYDCGGNATFTLFKSDSNSEKLILEGFECLSIQCAKQSKIFVGQDCNTAINPICTNKVLKNTNMNWQQTLKVCKSRHESYLFGDVDLTNAESACSKIQGNVPSPYWLGIAKDVYISIDEVQGQSIQYQRAIHSTYPRKCLKCNNKRCVFADCSERQRILCLERPFKPNSTDAAVTSSRKTTATYSESDLITKLILNSTTASTLEKTTNSTVSSFNNEHMMRKAEDSNIISVALPVSLTITLGIIGVLVVVLWKRRIDRNAQPKQNQHRPDEKIQHRLDSFKYSDKSTADHSLQNNYFVLDKRDKTYSTNDTMDDNCENLYNESGDGDYDHLGENVRKNVKEDIYHHAFFSSNKDESDYYGVRNIYNDNLTENPYDHTNTRSHQATIADNEYNTIPLNP